MEGAPPIGGDLVDAAEPDPVTTVAWQYGEASWGRDLHGDPLVRADYDGKPYEIAFYGCIDGAACRDLRFVARRQSEATAEDIALWNAEHRFGKLRMRDDGLLEMQMNVTLAGGVSPANLTAQFETWGVVIAQLAALP
ncbi:MAG: YbjN domain-containing protein [Pseudomonadota bacterium]